MRRLPILLLLLCLLPMGALCHAEEALFAWTVEIGGEGMTIPMAMALSERGGAFIAGNTSGDESCFGTSLGGVDGFIARVDADGNILWMHRYGGSGDDLFTHILEMEDGGCIAMGTTTSTDGDARASRGALDAFLVRLSADGETLWTKCLGGTLDDELLDIVLTEEGQLFVCGRTKSRNGDLGSNQGGWDAWAALLSDENSGKPLWVVRYGQAGDDEFTQAFKAPDGWVLLGVIAEETEESGESTYQSRPIVLMLSDTQEEIWQVSLGGAGINRLQLMAETEGGWVFAGVTNSTSVFMPTIRGGLDIWLLHLRQNGKVSWQRTFGGSSDDYAYQLRDIKGNGYALLSTTYSNDGQVQGGHGDQDLWMLRISLNGTLEWQQTIGGSKRSLPAGFLLTKDNGYLIAGTSLAKDGDIGLHASTYTGFVTKLTSNGNLEWTRLIGGKEACTLTSIKALNGKGYLLGRLHEEDPEDPRQRVFLSLFEGDGFE